MKLLLSKRLVTVFVCSIFIFSYFVPRLSVRASNMNTPTVTLTPSNNNAVTITLTFPQSIPSGNVVDIEFSGNNTKVWQYVSAQGGTSFTITTTSLANATYQMNVGLFTPNWASNYAWFNSLATVSIPFSSNNISPVLTVANTSTPSAMLLTARFSTSVPVGNIVDIEVYNSQNIRVWQGTSTAGGTTFAMITSTLPVGSYKASIGLFTSNWTENYGWYPDVANFSVASLLIPTPSPVTSLTSTPQPIQNASISASALSAYTDWRSKYVVSVDSSSSRVIRPENNNDTVSEGIGYGMLVSMFANDQTTFDHLWNYARKYLDTHGLMNWDINSRGAVIGSGSATDADEDMAYALIRANTQWSGKGYDTSAKQLIQAIKITEVLKGNLLNPGDNWGNTTTINPSYIAPSYYTAFAQISGDSQWNEVAAATSNWLAQAAQTTTGLTSDWMTTNFSAASITFDTHQNDFYYDALRTPIRMLLSYKTTGDTNARVILQKESNFFSGIGSNNLVSGYTTVGIPLDNYLDTAFLSAYAAAGQSNPTSSFGKSILQKLINTPPSGYFGTSLRVLTLFIIAQ